MPWLLLGGAFVTAGFIVAVIAWFAIVFTGRYPQALYDFNAGVIRFIARANAFFNLQTDEWPPFGWEEDAGYPIRASVGPSPDRLDRWKTGFRFIVGIPAMFMLYLIGAVWPVAAAVAWFQIVFRKRSAAGTHNVLGWGLAYQLRATAYFLLMTDSLPPVSEQEALTRA